MCIYIYVHVFICSWTPSLPAPRGQAIIPRLQEGTKPTVEQDPGTRGQLGSIGDLEPRRRSDNMVSVCGGGFLHTCMGVYTYMHIHVYIRRDK